MTPFTNWGPTPPDARYSRVIVDELLPRLYAEYRITRDPDNVVLDYSGDHQRPVGIRHLIDPDRPTRQHIHAVVRTPNGNDDGKDLLRQHYLQHPH